MLFVKKFWFLLILFTLAAGYFFLSFRQPVNVYDEGLIIYGAKKILFGALPYRDFWTIYSPGQFYVLAALFKLFGTTLFIERTYDIFVRSLLALTIYSIVARLTIKKVGLSVWLIVVLILGVPSNFGTALFLSTLLSLFATILLLDFYKKDRKHLMFFCGLILGASVLFRTDLGFYGAISFATFFVFEKFIRKRQSYPILLIAIGFIFPILMAVLYFSTNVPFGILIQDLFIFPESTYLSVRHLPILGPYLNALIPLIFYFVLIILTLSFLAIFLNALDFKKSKNSKKVLLLLTLLCLSFLIKGLSRMDEIHLAPALLLAIICLSIVFHLNLNWGKYKYLFSWFLSTLIFSIIGFAFLYTEYFISNYPLFDCYFLFKQSGCVAVDKDQAGAISYIKNRTSLSDRIFVGNSFHDRMILNDIAFYFLSDRDSATKYYELHPGLANTYDIQGQIVHELVNNHVNYIVLYSGFSGRTEPNKSSVSSGVFLLDKYIVGNYEPSAFFGKYEILQRKSQDARSFEAL